MVKERYPNAQEDSPWRDAMFTTLENRLDKVLGKVRKDEPKKKVIHVASNIPTQVSFLPPLSLGGMEGVTRERAVVIQKAQNWKSEC